MPRLPLPLPRLFALLLLALPACGGAPAPPADADAAQARPTAGERTAVSRELHARLQGAWAATPPGAAGRVKQLAEFALADPPDEAAFARMRPSPEEEEKFFNIIRLRVEEPDSPLLVELRDKLAQLDALRVTFTEDQLVTQTPDGTSVDAYEVVGDRSHNILLLLIAGESPESERRWMVIFDDDDHIVLAKDGSEVPFHRVGATSRAVAPRAVAPRAAPPRAAVAGGGAAPPPGAPPKTGDTAFDTCGAAYFDCTAQMPPEAQAAMKDSLDIVRARIHIAAQDPADRRSFTEVCERTVRTIKSSGLCR
ncbi:MAG TPA: hypothetical protein VLS89_14915 [Candidatus Nanopelagicales bacterium]|nr:hypothetical protein [Candidatus Nanopelagicales bacterium]